MATAWPFSDITPDTIGRWANRGRWDKIRRAASIAIRHKINPTTRHAATETSPEEKAASKIRAGTSLLGLAAILKPLDFSQRVKHAILIYGVYQMNRLALNSDDKERASDRNMKTVEELTTATTLAKVVEILQARFKTYTPPEFKKGGVPMDTYCAKAVADALRDLN